MTLVPLRMAKYFLSHIVVPRQMDEVPAAIETTLEHYLTIQHHGEEQALIEKRPSHFQEGAFVKESRRN